MKKLLFLILLTGITGGVFAQKGFRAGVKGAYNATFLFNKNVSDAGDELDGKFSFGPQFGITLGYMFTEQAGVTVDVLMGTITQKYSHRLEIDSIPLAEISADFESKVVLKTIDIPVLFHFGVGGGVYLEAGPQLSLISSGERTVEAFNYTVDVFGFSLSGNVPENVEDMDYTNGSHISAVLGVGYDINLTEKLALNAGLRFVWGLSDVYAESDFKTNDDFLLYNVQAKPSYEPTTAAAGGLHLGLTYNFSKD